MREQLTGDDIDELFLSLIDAPDFPPSSPSSSAETADLPVACDLAELADLPDLPDASTAAGAGNSGISGSSASSSGEELNATDELPLAVDEETRRLRRMARNRRAAAVSRQRKKEHVEALQAQLDVLRAENEQLRQRLSDAGLPCETDVHQQHSQQQPLLQQPAVGIPPAVAGCDDVLLSRAAPPLEDPPAKRVKRAKRVDTCAPVLVAD